MSSDNTTCYPVCWGLTLNNACGGPLKGSCSSPNNCSCVSPSTYTGSSCLTPVCFGSTLSAACNGMGTCTAFIKLE